MNKLRMQAQFVPIISFGISCSFKESDTVNQTVQSSDGSNCFTGMHIKILRCFLKGLPLCVTPGRAIMVDNLIYSKFPQLKKKKKFFLSFASNNRISIVKLRALELFHLFLMYQCHRINCSPVLPTLRVLLFYSGIYHMLIYWNELLPCGQLCNHTVHYVLFLQITREHIAIINYYWNKALGGKWG